MKHGHRWYASIDFTVRLEFRTTLVSVLIAPFAEEILFRGYIFRQLYRRAIPRSWSVSGGRLGPPPPFQDLMSRMNFP